MLLQRSVTGAVLIFVILLLRRWLKDRVPKKTFVVLWSVVMIHLMLPFSIPSSFSIYSMIPKMDTIFPAQGNTVLRETEIRNIPETVEKFFVFSEEEKQIRSRSFSPLVSVWAAGGLCLGVFFFRSYRRSRRKFLRSESVNDRRIHEFLENFRLRRHVEVRMSEEIEVPLTYGVFAPVILLPQETDWEDSEGLYYVLVHEWMHVRHWDALLKLVLMAVCCVYWFHPAVWLMAAFLHRDMELSCDECVISYLGEDHRASYASTLIRMEEQKIVGVPLYNYFGTHATEERVKALLSRRRIGTKALIYAIVLVFGVAVSFATSEKSAYSDEMVWETTLSASEGVDFPEEEEEWWTEEEFEAWLEEERNSLYSLVGTDAKYWSEESGEWRFFTKEWVEAAVSGYEEMLGSIRRGMKLSKSGFNGEGVMFSEMVEEPSIDTRVTTEQAGDFPREDISSSETEHWMREDTNLSEMMKDYRVFGIIYDKKKECCFFHGKVIHSLNDPGEFFYSSGEREGALDLHVVRNADGTIQSVVEIEKKNK